MGSNYMSLHRYTDEELLLSASRDRRVQSADDVVNIRKEPIAVDLEIHHESPDHRQIRQAPVNNLNRTISLPKDELDLFHSVCGDDMIHIKSIGEMRRERDMQEMVSNEKQKHWNRLASISDEDIMEYRCTKTKLSRQQSAPTRKLISSTTVEARLDLLHAYPMIVNNNPLLTSTPESQQTLSSNLHRPMSQPQRSKTFTSEPITFNGSQSQREPITFNGSQLQREPITFNGSQSQREPITFNSPQQRSESLSPPPPLQEVNSSQLDFLSPMESSAFVTDQFGAPPNISQSNQKKKALKKRKQRKGSRQVTGDARQKIQTNQQLKMNAGANNRLQSDTEVKVEELCATTRSPVTNSFHRKIPNTMSITQKRAMASGGYNESVPPAKLASGPSSPAHHRVDASDFWRSHSQNQSQPDLIITASNISMSRLNRLSDSLTGLQQSSAPASPAPYQYQRPIVYDVLNVSQEELDMTASYYNNLVKPEPVLPPLETITPPGSDSEWDDDDAQDQDVLDIHADDSLSESEQLLDLADELMR